METADVFNEEWDLWLKTTRRKSGTSVSSRKGRSFLSMVNSDHFDELPVHKVCSLLSSSFISVHSEMEVFMAAVKWLLFDLEKRQEYLVRVMACVRFGFMTRLQLMRVCCLIDNPKLENLKGISDLRLMVEEKLIYACNRRDPKEEPKWPHDWTDDFEFVEKEQRNFTGDKECSYESYQDFMRDLKSYSRKEKQTGAEWKSHRYNNSSRSKRKTWKHLARKENEKRIMAYEFHASHTGSYFAMDSKKTSQTNNSQENVKDIASNTAVTHKNENLELNVHSSWQNMHGDDGGTTKGDNNKPSDKSGIDFRHEYSETQMNETQYPVTSENYEVKASGGSPTWIH